MTCTSRPIVATVLLLAFAGASVGDDSLAGRAGHAVVRATTIDLSLEPATGAVTATAALEIVASGASESSDRVLLDLELLQELDVRWVRCAPPCERADLRRLAEAAGFSSVAEREDDGGENRDENGEPDEPERPVTRYRLSVEPRLEAGAAVTVEIHYAGIVREEWQRGEHAGQIHNFAARAHVGDEGVYLSGEAPWYPQRVLAEGEAPDLIDFEVTIEGSPGLLLVASGNRRDAGRPRAPGQTETWRSPFPLPELTVAGGPLTPFVRQVGGVGVWAHLSEENAGHAETLLDAAEHYLELYQPLVGPVPFREVTVSENFFSSGFAYPGFTLLAKAVIAMGEGSLRPGYLDHELLHNWWGNGVLGSPEGPIWSEALTSYCANLMRTVLEGDTERARSYRRSITERLSQLTDEAQKPLSSFGLEDGASRFIGYQKGSMVFAELARLLGEDAMWYALRNLASTRMGRYTGWDDLETSFERASARDLGAFFDYWVHGSGLPDLSPRAARWDGETSEVVLELAGPVPVAIPGFRLRALASAGATGESGDDVTIDLAAGSSEIRVRLPERPAAVAIDPEFETMRRIAPALWMPTISGISRRLPLAVLRASRESADADELYGKVVGSLKERYEDHEDELQELRMRPRAIERGLPLPAGHLFAFGEVVAIAPVREALAEHGIRVDVEAGGFQVGDTIYASATQSLLACVRRPNQPDAQICAYWGNSPAALERSYLLTFYGGDSVLVFDGGRPVQRERFAPLEVVAVE